VLKGKKAQGPEVGGHYDQIGLNNGIKAAILTPNF
jgi:hypothetical protein